MTVLEICHLEVTMQQPRNPEVGGLITGFIIAAAGGVAAVAPFLLNLDMMGEGYALMFVGGFVLLAGLVTAWIFRARFVTVQGLVAGKDLLARWSYPAPASEQLIEQQYAEYSGNNRATLLIVTVFFFLIGGSCLGITYVAEGEFLWSLAYAFLAILALLGTVAYVAPRLERRRALRAARDVYIGRKGILIQGALLAWGTVLAQLEKVAYVATPQGAELQFTVRSLSSVGVLHYERITQRVPVPPGQEQAAQEAARRLQSERR